MKFIHGNNKSVLLFQYSFVSYEIKEIRMRNLWYVPFSVRARITMNAIITITIQFLKKKKKIKK